MKRFLELVSKRTEEIDEQLLEMLYSFTEFQTFKEIVLAEKRKMEQERKKMEESVKKKKIPQKPLKQSSNNNNNIFSMEKKNGVFKEEHKIENKNKNEKIKGNKINENKQENIKNELNVKILFFLFGKLENFFVECGRFIT